MNDQIVKPWKEDAMNKAVAKVFSIVGMNPDAKTPRAQGFKDFFIAGWNAAVEQIKDEASTAFRMDELDAVMTSVDKWLEGDDLKNNPATRAADAREIALKAIEKEAARANRAENEVQLVRDCLRVHGVSDERIGTAAWRGIDVLETRYRKDINAATAEIAALTFIPSGREHEIRCCFSACSFGQGLTETGRCSGGGNPRDPSCKRWRGTGTSDASEQNCRY